jgi:serine/threonine protein kinase
MSPECLNDGVATTASDLWSFGIVLLQAVLGYFPLDFSDAMVSSDTSAAPQAEFAFDSTSHYWQLHNVLASVKSPIYVPSIRQVLDALGRAYDVEVLDFFDRCLHPVQPNALLLSFSASVLFFSCHAFASFAHFCCTGCKHALKCQGTAVS